MGADSQSCAVFTTHERKPNMFRHSPSGLGILPGGPKIQKKFNRFTQAGRVSGGFPVRHKNLMISVLRRRHRPMSNQL
jgi:hypothetical protein